MPRATTHLLCCNSGNRSRIRTNAASSKTIAVIIAAAILTRLSLVRNSPILILAFLSKNVSQNRGRIQL